MECYREKLKGEKIDVYIPSSNVMITGLNTDDNWRKYRIEGNDQKTRKQEKKPSEQKIDTETKKAEPIEEEIKKPTKPKQTKEDNKRNEK